MQFSLILCGLLLTVTSAFAAEKPDFSQSTITFSPEAPLEGDLVTMIAELRNSGDEAALHTEMMLSLPGGALFVDVAGIGGAIADLDERTVRWTGQLDAGSTHRLNIRLIVPRDAGGETLASTMQVRYLFTGSESWIHGQANVGTRLSGSGPSVAGVRTTGAGTAVLVLLAGAAALYLLVRWRIPRAHHPFRPVAAIVIAVGFWTMFASMARYDWRVLREYRETQCTILDSRVRFETTTNTTAPRDANGRRRETTTVSPLLALRYQANDVEHISTGFDTGSHVQIGGAARAAAAMKDLVEGANVPCWYDPLDPQQVVVRRGFGGAYFFALFPLPVLFFAIWLLRAEAQQ